MKDKIKETIENFSSIDSNHGLNSYTISERNLERLTEDLVELFSMHSVVGQREQLNCNTCTWFKSKSLVAPCSACFGRKKHHAI